MSPLLLVRRLTETRLQYSTFGYQIEEFNFSLFHQISTNATIKFGRTNISDSCFRVSFISGSVNNKSHDNFSFVFSISVKFFLWPSGVPFLKFLENYQKKRNPCDLFNILLHRRSHRLRRFWGSFLNS